MRTDCLTDLQDINLDLLPQIIRNEFEKIKFKFDINYLGVYSRQNLFAKVYVHFEFVWNQELLNERVKFNENVKNSIDEYDDGFHDAFYDVNFLQHSENENYKIIEVFSFVYNKYKFIDNPSILHFKNNYNRYNGLNFLENQMYDYGFEVGNYIKCWQIILNNFDLFENVFNKYFIAKELTIQVDNQPQLTDNSKTLKNFTFKNNFDNVSENKIIEYFKTNLVDKNYILVETLIDFIELAFDKKTIPAQKFNFDKLNTQNNIVKIFYNYFKIIAGKPYSKQKEYLNLLINYFNGFENFNIKNFSK